MFRPRLRTTCLLLALCALAACGGGDGGSASQGERPAVEWVDAQLEGAALPESKIETVHRLVVPEALGKWRLTKGEGAIVEHEGGRALRLEGKQAHTIVISGHFDPSEFNSLVIHGEVPQLERIGLAFLRKGEGFLRHEARIFLEGEKTLEIELEGISEAHGAFDALVIKVEGRSPWSLLTGFELQRLPADFGLPRPAEGARWMTIDGQARRAVGLRGGERLAGRMQAAEGKRFELSVALPVLARRSVGDAELRVTLSAAQDAGASPLVQSVPLRQLLGVPRPWVQVALDLDSFAGEDVLWSVELVGGADSACLIERPALVRATSDAPVVLFITSDTHRRDYLGAADSHIDVDTPYLDALSERGVLFSDAYSSTNITVPSHVSMLTGVHPRATGVIDNADSLGEAARTLAESFEEAGYTCLASVCGAHLGPETSGLGQGFTRFSTPVKTQHDSTDAIAPLERWLGELEGRPLFIWLHIFDAHAPYDVHTDWRKRYYPADRDPFDAELPEPANHSRPSWARKVRDLDFIEARYRGEVSYLDQKLGELLENPLLENAHIALTADHGEAMGERGSYWDHVELYPNTLGVPLIFAGPGLPEELRGAKVERSVTNLDTGRTLLDWVGAKGSEFPGRDLFELARSNESEPRYSVSVRGESASVEVGGWYLLMHLMADYRHGGGEGPELHAIELYKLSDDPRCEENIVEEEPERARRMRELLISFLTSTEDTGWDSEAPATAQTLDMVRALGYTQGLAGYISDDWYDVDCDCDWCSRY